MNRRGFLTGVAGLLAAPAIVRAGSLMPISVQPKVWAWEQGPVEIYADPSVHRAEMLRLYEILKEWQRRYPRTHPWGRDF